MSHLCTPPGGPGFDRLDPLSGEVIDALRRASMLRHRLMMAILPPEQAHPAQAGYLLALEQHVGISQTDLAAMMHVSRPTVTAMLQKLESAGLVERRSDEHDQRVTRIHITTEGSALAARMHEAHIEAVEASIGRLSEDDRRELLRLLGTLNDVTQAALKERGVTP